MEFGIIVDVETTGLDTASDHVIEIGLVEFAWNAKTVPSISRMYGGLQDPGVTLSNEIIKLTGLTNDLLAGQGIDWPTVQSMWARASFVVAHNAEFDRGFLNRLPQLNAEVKHWACSVRHIDWRSKGFESRRLNYLAADHGFVNPFAHRALFDCATTFRIVRPHLAELIQRSHEPEIKFIAVGSSFETKDILKSAGYRWDNEQRVWHKTIGASAAEEERAFLTQKVYKGAPKHIEETIWFNPKR